MLELRTPAAWLTAPSLNLDVHRSQVQGGEEGGEASTPGCVQVCIRLELLARLGSLASDIYLRGSLVILGYANYPLDVWKLLA